MRRSSSPRESLARLSLGERVTLDGTYDLIVVFPKHETAVIFRRSGTFFIVPNGKSYVPVVGWHLRKTEPASSLVIKLMDEIEDPAVQAKLHLVREHSAAVASKGSRK